MSFYLRLSSLLPPSVSIMEQDSEYLLLNSIQELTNRQADISQRDLSRAIHLSLGMTNVLIKRLREKGFILIHKASARNVSYVLTPEGMNELAKRTYRYLKRTMRKVADYKDTILAITKDAQKRGFRGIAVLGASDIEFIIEYASQNAGLAFSVIRDPSLIPEGSFVFISESYSGSHSLSPTSIAHLYHILTGE